MSQFALDGVEWGVQSEMTDRKLENGFRNDSVAFVYLRLTRQTGYFLLQEYTPLVLMVMCSYVSFWIVKTDVPGRCGLGVTTVLAVAKLGLVGGGKPEVPYATAMDTFVIICFSFVFGSLIEVSSMNSFS